MLYWYCVSGPGHGMYLTSPPIQRYRVSTPLPTTALSSLTMVSSDMILPPLYVNAFYNLQTKLWSFRWFHLLVLLVDIFDSRQNKSRHINVDPRLPHKNFLRWWFRTNFDSVSLVSSCFKSFVANCYVIEQTNRYVIQVFERL